MINRVVTATLALVFVALTAASCRRAAGPVQIAIDPNAAAGHALIRVTGLSSRELQALSASAPDAAGWAALFRVRVAGAAADAPAVAGAYAVTSTGIEFTPKFPFIPGMSYAVAFDPSRMPTPRTDVPVSATVSLPKTDREPSTVVTRILPTASQLPENQLRMYIEFSAPMSRTSGVEFISLTDSSGAKVIAPFLPLDVEFWNPDRTRYTVFFDPGRVKRGIFPNEQMGRAIHAGRTYTMTVDAAWRDANGLPLASPYRQTFQVGPADEQPISLDTWRWTVPQAGRKDPLIISFPEPLDHGLLMRAVGVSRRDGVPVTGDVRVDPGETRWNFTPTNAWQPGRYTLIVLPILEDLAGNRIGRLFEVDTFEKVDDASAPREQYSLPFEVK